MEALIRRFVRWLNGWWAEMRSWLRHLTAGFKRPSGGAAMLDHILLEREDAPRPPLGRRLLHGLTAPFRALWRLTRWLFRTLIRLIRSILRLLGRLLRLPIRLIAWPFRRRRIRKIVRTPETGAKPRLRYRDVLSWPFRLAAGVCACWLPPPSGPSGRHAVCGGNASTAG